ncbi:MAG: hydroxymethylbilane synthase [Microbacteriaceae bacterium]|nr:hydroxymethylbilane synthase [Microbacteriaceae bacterium]
MRLGTRGSALALAQSGQVAAAITKATGEAVELVAISTEGDHSSASLASLGGTGVFASALREALLAGECDLVVHSLKDLPTDGYPGLRLGAIPKRADARDALIGSTLAALEPGAKVGTGSPRRVAQLRAARADIDVVDLRGNVDTRIAKVGAGLDAVVLALAGLSRLGRLDEVTETFELGDWPTAPGQGALALEVRDDGASVIDAALKAVDHTTSRLTVLAERAVLAQLEAGCAAPIGATAVLDGELLFLSATVYAPDGSSSLTSAHALVMEGSHAERALLPTELGERVAAELLKLGAADLAPLGAGS